MAIGSPGMEMGDRVDRYEVMAFGEARGEYVFAQHGRSQLLPIDRRGRGRARLVRVGRFVYHPEAVEQIPETLRLSGCTVRHAKHLTHPQRDRLVHLHARRDEGH
jgi:hypothetical protein